MSEAATAHRTAGANAVASVIAALQDRLGDRLSLSQAVREQHGRGETWHATKAPDAVAFADSGEEVQAIVGICAAHKVPVIAFGTGTSLEGHVAAEQGGICIDLSRMDRILQVNPDDMDVRVQPGVRRKQLNEHLRDTGLFFPIDPGADASLGGMTATRASGTNAVRYGTMRENVLSVEAVLADGRVIRTARRARKSSAGYDLTRLFVGSEGTLGVITEITLKLYGIPEAISAAVCPFASLDGAVATTIETIQSGIPVARIEILDDVQMQDLNAYSNLSLPEKDTLFLEFHGTADGVKEQARLVQEIAAANGGEGFQWTVKPEERSRLWQARHDAAYAAKAAVPGGQLWATDVCVPISRLAECIAETKADLQASFLRAPIVGHVGDGNFHVAFVLRPDHPEEFEEATRINDRLVQRSLAMDGTCTGEHGVGNGKIKYLQAELGDSVSVMRQIKMALDPDNIMNPGKIVRV
ncbi:MAG: FAD-linked oxidase C-terminal domain-containing protein [Sneathiellaceae bacterium]